MHVAVDGEGVDMNMSEVFWVIFPHCVWLPSEFDLLLSRRSSFSNPSLGQVQCIAQRDGLDFHVLQC